MLDIFASVVPSKKIKFLTSIKKMCRIKSFPLHAMQAQKGCGSITVLMLNLRVACGWVVNPKPRVLYPREGVPSHVADEAKWAGIDGNSEIKTS